MQFPRHVSPRVVVDFAKMLESTGVIDDILTYDYLASLIPRSLWTPDVTPAARFAPDDDSYHDAFILAAIASSVSDLGITILTDAMRRGPWLVQTMLSLAGATPGRVALAMGAGEARHAGPFGYARNEGLGRLRDLLKVWNLFIGASGPVDFDGKYWKVSRSYVGSVQPAKPKIFALGGGLEPPFDREWHYAKDLHPLSMTRADAEKAVSLVTPEMVRKSLIVGTAAEVASELQKYVDAGVTWIGPSDVGAFTGGDQQKLISGILEVCRLLKGNPSSQGI
jgi:alkanesulfonate monooxygenase SsuD/methylene tetrahydromethanopterin reductase-like flavin-dependent oxidoreductase (luciferase family)